MKPWANELSLAGTMILRHIVMLVDTDLPLSAAVTDGPGIEVYHIASEDDIDLKLLNDLHSPVMLAFSVGSGPGLLRSGMAARGYRTARTLKAICFGFGQWQSNGIPSTTRLAQAVGKRVHTILSGDELGGAAKHVRTT